MFAPLGKKCDFPGRFSNSQFLKYLKYLPIEGNYKLESVIFTVENTKLVIQKQNRVGLE